MGHETIYEVRCACRDAALEVYYHKAVTYDPATIVACPANIPGHTLIDVAIVGTVEHDVVSVKEDKGATQGLWRVGGRVHDIPGATGPYSFDSALPPYPTQIFRTVFQVLPENVGDSLTILSAPNTVAGTTTAPVAVGQTVFAVSEAASSVIRRGHIITLTDGVTTTSLGECVAFDTDALTITTSVPSANAYASAGVSVVFSVLRVNSVFLTSAGDKALDYLTGGIPSPPSAVTRLVYNNANGVAKKIYYYTTIYY